MLQAVWQLVLLTGSSSTAKLSLRAPGWIHDVETAHGDCHCACTTHLSRCLNAGEQPHVISVRDLRTRVDTSSNQGYLA